MVTGGRGQFDVLAEGNVVASRSGGFFTRLLGGGWPEEDAVLADLEQRRS
ncbi:hypothetical protein ACFL59_08875 [Planctomycetota bacterium]